MIGDPVRMDLNEALFYMIEAHTYAVQNIAKKDRKSDEYTNAIRGAMAFEIAIEAMQKIQNMNIEIERNVTLMEE